MFSKIMIATDLSMASNKLIECIEGLKLLGASEAVLFHALRIRHLDYMKFALARDAEPFLILQQDTLEKMGFKTSIEIAPGETAYELNHSAKNNDISLIVMGTHGKSLLAHAAIGGEASKILHHHQKPLLIVRIKVQEDKGISVCEASCLKPDEKILFATDFSDTAQRAFTYLEKMVECGWKNISLIHVQDSTKIDKHFKDRLQEFNEIDDERLQMLADSLRNKGATKVDKILPYGRPAQEIIKASKNDSYSMIIMGSQGRGFAEEIFLGSVSHNVVRQADIPVILIPALR